MLINNNNLSNFYKAGIAGFDMLVSNDFPASAIQLTADQYRDGVRGPFEKVSSSKHANVLRAKISFNGRHHLLYIKQYLYRSFGDRMKHLFRSSRGRRALSAAAMLTASGLDSPAVVALAEKRCGFFCTDCILITEALKDAKSIYAWQNNWKDQPPAKLKHQFVSQLGVEIGKMHKANIFHGDLRPGNVFAKQTPQGWHFYFLDNERTVKMPILPMRYRLKNLIQINMPLPHTFTRTDRLRFYKEYLKQNPQLETRAAAIAKRVSQKAAERLEKVLSRLELTQEPQVVLEK